MVRCEDCGDVEKVKGHLVGYSMDALYYSEEVAAIYQEGCRWIEERVVEDIRAECKRWWGTYLQGLNGKPVMGGQVFTLPERGDTA